MQNPKAKVWRRGTTVSNVSRSVSFRNKKLKAHGEEETSPVFSSHLKHP